MSEEQFAASLEADAPPRAETRPSDLRAGRRHAGGPEHGAPADTVARVADPGSSQDNEAEWDLVSSSAQPHGAVMNEPEWKQEVASRLEDYRARRGSRRPRYEGTLSLDFDRAANRMAVQEEAEPVRDEAPMPEYVPEAVARAAVAESPMPAEDPGPPNPGLWADSEPQSNIIEFPRSPTLFEAVLPPSDNDLAEPMINRPRILEVPEEVHCAQAPLAGIELEAEEERAPAAELELPLRVAPMGQRVFAGLVDAVIIAVATAVFLIIVLRGDFPPLQRKLAVVLLAALPAVLWAIYEYLFLVHAARTPGMQMARLAITEFDGAVPDRRTRRVRAIGTVLSLLSLGLGMFWALLDEDTLCWHDRMSRTYMNQVE